MGQNNCNPPGIHCNWKWFMAFHDLRRQNKTDVISLLPQKNRQLVEQNEHWLMKWFEWCNSMEWLTFKNCWRKYLMTVKPAFSKLVGISMEFPIEMNLNWFLINLSWFVEIIKDTTGQTSWLLSVCSITYRKLLVNGLLLLV